MCIRTPFLIAQMWGMVNAYTAPRPKPPSDSPMKSARWVPASVGILAALLTACGGSGSDPSSHDLSLGGPQPGGPIIPPQDKDAPDEATRPPLGGHIDGLTISEQEAFERGRVVFDRRFTPSTGLGPLYNAVSCASCHSTPISGGSAQLYRNFYIAAGGIPGNQFELPGLPSFIVPAYGAGALFSLERGRAVIPDSFGSLPVTVAQRNSIPLFGTGLFEFVSNVTIMGMSDPNDTDMDGISGRYNQDSEGIGRFGNRLQTNNVELFTRGPLFNQMGITTDPFDGSGATVSLAYCSQVGSDPNDPTVDFDGIEDPEMSTDDLGDLLAYTRFLAPVGKLEPFSASAYRGQVFFEDIGCTACHVPSIPSSRGPVGAYTDLLLHEMGAALADGISMGTPQPSTIEGNTTHTEWRTTPLWGVSLHGPFLHDGRAETLHEAIDLHAGEGLAARDAFVALTARQQADLIEFLEHL